VHLTARADFSCPFTHFTELFSRPSTTPPEETSMNSKKSLIAAAATLLLRAHGAGRHHHRHQLPLTGPASGLGIPVNNQIKLWPAGPLPVKNSR
jgi:hypothetical protein